MKPTIFEQDLAHYIEEYDLVNFIEKNQTEMDWNQICDFIKNFTNENGITLYTKNDKELPFWINEFFKAHPFLSKVYFVFND